MKIAVFGSGMVGNAIAMDLASRHHVTAFDVSNANLELLKKRNPRIETQQADLQNYSSLSTIISYVDIVVTAVPGFMGYKALEAGSIAERILLIFLFFLKMLYNSISLQKKKG